MNILDVIRAAITSENEEARDVLKQIDVDVRQK